MEGFIDVCGTPIEIKGIKKFKVINAEYIFRPVYREEKVKKLLSTTKKYVYESMEPYAAIKSGKRQGGLMGFVKTQKDAHIRYEMVNTAGRTMTAYFDEIPVLVYLEDGRKVEVFKDNKEYNILGRDRTPVIEMIEALYIKAKDEYVFYGRDINLFSVLNEYDRVKKAVENYRNRKNKKDDTDDQKAADDKDDSEETSDKAVSDKLQKIKAGTFSLVSKAKGKLSGAAKSEKVQEVKTHISEDVRDLMNKYDKNDEDENDNED